MDEQSNRLIWLDLEMTGLSLKRDVILEIATVVTDNSLEVIAEGPCIAIQCDNERLRNMDDWNQQHHNDSGLVQRVRDSAINNTEAEEQTLAFLNRYVEKGYSPMCGSTICTDRQFLNKYMPNLAEFFHYRNLDVSSFKEVFRRWFPKAKRIQKKSQHLALSDVYDSIEELRFYRRYFINYRH